MFSFKATCINLGKGDFFREAIAIDNKYLAISNSFKNRITIHTSNRFGKWRKAKEVAPPEGSVPAKYGEGFGTKLYLKDDVLAIETTIFQHVDNVINPDDFILWDETTALFKEVYSIKLSSESEVKPVKEDLLSLHQSSDKNIRSHQTIFKGKIRKVIFDRNNKHESLAVASCNNLLLVGHASHYRGGEAWLYDLNTPQKQPEKISATDLYIGTTVAVSKYFTAIGEIGTLNPPPLDAPYLKSKTLVRAIDNGATSIIDSYGKVSLSGNILAIMRDSAQGHRIALLEVFRLDRYAVPRLIIKRKNIKRAFVQNGFLVTVEKRGNLKMYIRPIS